MSGPPPPPRRWKPANSQAEQHNTKDSFAPALASSPLAADAGKNRAPQFDRVLPMQQRSSSLTDLHFDSESNRSEEDDDPATVGATVPSGAAYNVRTVTLGSHISVLFCEIFRNIMMFYFRLYASGASESSLGIIRVPVYPP